MTDDGEPSDADREDGGDPLDWLDEDGGKHPESGPSRSDTGEPRPGGAGSGADSTDPAGGDGWGDPNAEEDPDPGGGEPRGAEEPHGRGWPGGAEDEPPQESGRETNGPGPGSPGSGGDDPFGEPDPRGDPFESGENVFERQEVGEVDPDAVWERLSELEGGSVTERGESTYAEVSKHSYCEGCEYFSAPPEVACTHEEAEIVEFLDMDTVRLLNCPVVAERRQLEREG
jgi:hypothetical protein